MNFSKALEELKDGRSVTRAGWTQDGVFLFLVPGSAFKVDRPPLLGIYPPGTMIDYHAHLDIRTSSGQIVPYAPTQTDILGDDWSIYDRLSAED